MYWFRDGSNLALLPWLAALLLSWLAGWLLATHSFKLNKNERLIAGLALGIVLSAWLLNVIGRWLPSELAFWAAPLILLLMAALVAWRSPQRPVLHREDLQIWPWLVAGLGMVWLFLLWSKGLALFDEHKNLSLISIMANGDIPPRYSLFPDVYLAYHYGFHLFAAGFMRLGGMLPWSAFDAAKAVTWGIALLLAAALGRRMTGTPWGGWATAAVLALASGVRYLLLVLPPSILLRADSLIQLQGTSALIGQPFSQALLAGWPVDGGPPMPYPFAFLNGILQPFVMAHQGPTTFAVLILLLMWLLLPRLSGRVSIVCAAILMAMWALVWESSYALFAIGLVGFAGLYYLRKRTLGLPYLPAALIALAVSAPMVLLQGGTFTEMARELLGSFGGTGLRTAGGLAANWLPALPPLAAEAGSGFLGFTFRWPLAIVSSHLGPLRIFSPVELLVALFELGPIVLFAPLLTVWAWRRAHAGEWLLGALTVAAWAGLLLPIVFQYEADRDISRLTSQALLIWALMLVFAVADRAARWSPGLRVAGIAALALACLGGLFVAGIQFTAASSTQLGAGFDKLDAEFSSQVWGTFPDNARLLGPLGSTTILTGQLSGQLLGDAPAGSELALFEETPTLELLRLYQYDYLYIDSRWWQSLPEEMRLNTGLQNDCVVTLSEVWDNSHVNFRRLLDVSACK
ncbi:MAG: hypothetical protein KIS88_08700 [Anaerolineales bacterium]|nr:hypothetical protein [Anaerolineales bacterium]